MNNKFLHDHASVLSDFAKETLARAQQNPDDFLLQLAARNQADAAQEATHALMLEAADEAGELVDLRLLGPRADGTISLDWFLKAMDPLSRAWKLAAHHLRYGNDHQRGAVGADVVTALNLKLAGIGHGSTRIFVTGNAMPDLTGESLLQATLQQVFQLLNARQDDFYDAVDAVGGRAAHQMGEFMRELDRGGFAAEFSWHAPRGHQFWEGRPDEIMRIRALLDTVKEPERYPETLTGGVAGITDTGKLELRTEGGKVVIRFPLRLTEQVQRLTIAAPATIEVETARYWDSVQKKDLYKRQLIKVL